MHKEQIREMMRHRKQQFTQDQLRRQSVSVIDRLLKHPRLQSAQTILMYYSLPDEVFTHDVIRQLADMGKDILLPAIADRGTMVIRRYQGDNDLSEGAFHIMEPIGPLWSSDKDIDLAVIPGMAFDNHGNRLGRGKGYYDRFLSNYPSLYKIGVCFDFQKTASVPVGRHDISMNEVL